MRLMFVVIMFLTMSLESQMEIVLTDVEKKWLKNNPVIRVSNEMDWAPYDYNVKGSHKVTVSHSYNSLQID